MDNKSLKNKIVELKTLKLQKEEEKVLKSEIKQLEEDLRQKSKLEIFLKGLYNWLSNLIKTKKNG